MTTLRVARRDRFVAIDQRTINDSTLSFRARGILAWLLDKPEDWSCDSAVIARAGREGRDAIRAAMRELEAFGYLRREKRQDETGRWMTVTWVHERPDAWKSGVGEPVVGGPGAEPKTKTKDEDQPPLSPRKRRSSTAPVRELRNYDVPPADAEEIMRIHGITA